MRIHSIIIFSWRIKKKYQIFFTEKKVHYGKCQKILYTLVSDKSAYANNADPDQNIILRNNCTKS